MKTYTDCEILYLSDEDLTKEGKEKTLEELNYYDFTVLSYNLFIKAYVVIYKNSKGEYKVLKSRY